MEWKSSEERTTSIAFSSRCSIVSAQYCIRLDTGPGLRTPGCGKSSNIVFLTIFGRTELRISLSKAKIEPEADFDVRFAVARQNPGQISKKRKFRSEIFTENLFLASKNETSGVV